MSYKLLDDFQLFAKTYNKQYETAEEAQLRYNNFKVFSVSKINPPNQI